MNFNQGFNLNLIGKYWYKRDNITQSINIGWYISPRLKNNFSEIHDFEIFPILNTKDLGNESLSQFIPSCYEEININEIETNQLCCDSLTMVDNSISKCCVTHSSYMDSCNSLYNNMKNNEQISHLIVGLLVKFKQIINSKDEKHFIVDNLSKRVDNYKNLFTNMKDNNIINLTEPSKKSPTESNKSKISI